MAVSDPRVFADLLDLITQLAGDWEYSGPVTAETLLVRDLGLESLDLVVLGTSIQHRYGRIPFAELLADLGQRPVEQRDLSVADLVAFVSRHRSQATAGEAQ